ncbi:MAG TPA: hypothetical protein VM242_01130 [Acidimicrobiales bacterium]|nr:hypothetical protein [Acidimicrobiales bacterium]
MRRIARGEFPADLRAFVERCFTSAVQLEVLLLMHERPGGAWTAASVGRELRVDPEQAGAALGHLARSGLLAREREAFHLRPRRPRDARLVSSLAELYPTYRVAIVSIIFSKPSGPIRDFSDAFRLRDED